MFEFRCKICIFPRARPSKWGSPQTNQLSRCLAVSLSRSMINQTDMNLSGAFASTAPRLARIETIGLSESLFPQIKQHTTQRDLITFRLAGASGRKSINELLLTNNESGANYHFKFCLRRTRLLHFREAHLHSLPLPLPNIRLGVFIKFGQTIFSTLPRRRNTREDCYSPGEGLIYFYS